MYLELWPLVTVLLSASLECVFAAQIMTLKLLSTENLPFSPELQLVISVCRRKPCNKFSITPNSKSGLWSVGGHRKTDNDHLCRC